MGEIEDEIKKKNKRAYIQKIILATLATTGLMSMAILAPNAIQSLRLFGVGNLRKKNHKYVVNRSIERLIKNKLIVYEKTDKGAFLRLTKEGKSKLYLFTVM